MPKYVIEREIAGAGKLSSDQLRDVSIRSIDALQKMGFKVQWIQSYLTNDKIFCVYAASSEDAIREHARLGGFPVTRVSEVKQMIDPSTAEA